MFWLEKHEFFKYFSVLYVGERNMTDFCNEFADVLDSNVAEGRSLEVEAEDVVIAPPLGVKAPSCEVPLDAGLGVKAPSCEVPLDAESEASLAVKGQRSRNARIETSLNNQGLEIGVNVDAVAVPDREDLPPSTAPPGSADGRDEGPDSGLCSFGQRGDGDLDNLEDKGMCSSCNMQ